MRVKLELQCDASATAEDLISLLAPDNKGLPRGQTLTVNRRASSLVLDCASDDQLSALSTMVSILEDLALFQEVWLLSPHHGG